jgi:hypothetical protein
MSTFLAAGDVLINPALLAYAVVDADTEGQKVRLGFSGSTTEEPWELVVQGVEARSVLRWLRSHAEFLDSGGPSFPRGRVASTRIPLSGARN